MIQVRRSTYHDKPGWSVVGHPKGDTGGFPIHIWVHRETTARQIAALYKVTPRDDLAISTLILEEKVKTYTVTIIEHYIFQVEADSESQALEVAEMSDRDRWDYIYGAMTAKEKASPAPTIDATIRKV